MVGIVAPILISQATATSPKASSPKKALLSKSVKDVKSPTKAAKAKPKSAVKSHPTYSDMIKKAVNELKEKKGSSRAAILKYILANYKVGNNFPQVNSHIRQALKKGVASGSLKQTKGTGASGSFRVGEAKKPVVKKAAPSVKKPTAKKSTAASGAKKTAPTKKLVSSKKSVAVNKTKKPTGAASSVAASTTSAPVAPTVAAPSKKSTPNKKTAASPAKKASPSAKKSIKIKSPAKKAAVVTIAAKRCPPTKRV